VFKHDQDKIMELDSHKLMVGAGVFADSVNFTEYVQKNLKLYELNNDMALGTHAAANFVRNEVRLSSFWLLELGSFSSHPPPPPGLHHRSLRQPPLHSCAILPGFARVQLATALRKGPYQTNILLAGYDEQDGVGLYYMDYMASLSKVAFGAHGYCASFVLSVFDREWKEGLSLEEALDVVRKCLHELRTRFLISQPNFVIKVVDKTGLKTVQL